MSSVSLSSSDPEPSNYLIRLLKKAEAYFLVNDVPRDLSDCDPGIAEGIKALPSLPPSELDGEIQKLAQALTVLPKFRERLALAVNYSTGDWSKEQFNDYVICLLREAATYFRSEDLPRELANCNSEIAQRIK